MKQTIHIAVPLKSRAAAATIAHLSGSPTEFSIQLRPAIITPGQDREWWGSSHRFISTWIDEMIDGNPVLRNIGLFAVVSDAGAIVEHNLTTPPTGPRFSHFLSAAGLEIVASGP